MLRSDSQLKLLLRKSSFRALPTQASAVRTQNWQRCTTNALLV